MAVVKAFRLQTVSLPNSATAQPQPAPHKYGLGLWVRRMLVSLTVAFVVLISAGAIYQTIAIELDKRPYPPPGLWMWAASGCTLFVAVAAAFRDTYRRKRWKTSHEQMQPLR